MTLCNNFQRKWGSLKTTFNHALSVYYIICIIERLAGNHLAIQHNTVTEEVLSEGTAPPEDTDCGTQLGKGCAYGIGSLHSYELS